MGTHPKGPSIHMGRNIPLSDWLTTYPEFLGEKMRKAFPGKGELPFLFKVLSVGQSLSIQAHPDKVRLIMAASLIKQKLKVPHQFKFFARLILN